ncbi:MAG: glycosyltransferase family 4 protein [Myxococcaceae bacterium]|nr:glycosyltransferase family 4 protein [Myxococcaceae bacterium]
MVLAGLALRLPLRAPIFVRLHGPHFLNARANGQAWDETSRVTDALERDAVSRAAVVTSPSRDTLARSRAHWGLQLPGAVVIPNPVRTVGEKLRWAGRSEGPILFVGRFDRHKGFDVVVRAFREIAPSFPGRELWLVGPERTLHDGAHAWTRVADFLSAELPDAAVRARVKYLGSRTPEEIRRLRQACVCVVVASRFETFCIAAVEAMMAGCPLVSSDAAALAELVEDGVTGLTFRSEDVPALARALARILESPELARRLSENGLKTAMRRYAPEVIVGQTLELYREAVLARSRRAAPLSSLSRGQRS